MSVTPCFCLHLCFSSPLLAVLRLEPLIPFPLSLLFLCLSLSSSSFFVCVLSLLLLCHVFVQATGPFLHIGALVAVTALSWIVAGQIARAEKTRKFTSALQRMKNSYLTQLSVSHTLARSHSQDEWWMINTMLSEARTSTQGVRDNEHSYGLMWCFPARTPWIIFTLGTGHRLAFPWVWSTFCC